MTRIRMLFLLNLSAGLLYGQSEFLVNTTLDSTQRAPRVVTDGAGNSVVVWSGTGPGGLGARRDIMMQRFDQSGVAVGPETVVNTTVAGEQELPSVAMDPSGSVMVVVWRSIGPADSMYDIRARWYLGGAPAGPDIVVNTTRAFSQANPDLSVDSLGNAVIVWDSWYQDGGDRGVYGRRFGPSSAPLGDEFRLSTTTAYSQAKPAIAHLSTSQFVTVWESWGQDAPGEAGYGVIGRIWNGDGSPASAEFLVNTYTADYQWYAAVRDLGPDRFAVAWCSWGEDGGEGGIYCRLFDVHGVPLTGEIPVNNSTANYQWLPRICRRGADGLAIAWSSWKQDGSREGVMVRSFDAVGRPLTFEQAVNQYTNSYQWEPDVAQMPGGDLLVVWSTWGRSGKDYEIAGRRIAPALVQARLSSATVTHPFWRSTTEILVHVQDSLAMTGHSYEVIFDSLGSRSASATVRNVSRGDTVVRDFPVMQGENVFYLTPVFDGVALEISPEFDLALDLQRSAFVNHSGTNIGFLLTTPGVSPSAKRIVPVDAALIWGSCDTLAGGRYANPLDTALNSSGQRVVAVPFLLWNLTDNQKMDPFVPETKVNQRWDPGEVIRFRTPVPYRVAINEMHAEIQTSVPAGPLVAPAPGDTHYVYTMRPIREGETYGFVTARSAILEAPPVPGPSRFALLNNFPNPFNPSTTILYTVPSAARVRLEVYSILGQRVATLVDGIVEAGKHRVQFEASHLASGVYFCRLSADGRSITRRIAFIR
jgi:hypothetical protein